MTRINLTINRRSQLPLFGRYSCSSHWKRWSTSWRAVDKMGEWLDWESGWSVVKFPTTPATQQSTRQKLDYWLQWSLAFRLSMVVWGSQNSDNAVNKRLSIHSWSVVEVRASFHWMTLVKNNFTISRRCTKSLRFWRARCSSGVGGGAVAGITGGGSSPAGELERRLLVAWLIAALSALPPSNPWTSTINFSELANHGSTNPCFVRPCFNLLLHKTCHLPCWQRNQCNVEKARV